MGGVGLILPMMKVLISLFLFLTLAISAIAEVDAISELETSFSTEISHHMSTPQVENGYECGHCESGERDHSDHHCEATCSYHTMVISTVQSAKLSGPSVVYRSSSWHYQYLYHPPYLELGLRPPLFA